MRTFRAKIGIGLSVAVVLFLSWGVTAYGRDNAEGPAQHAREILKATGVNGGLVVHIGCGDGRLTAALRANDACLVHGLDADAGDIERARAFIRKQGLYGPVSVERWTGGRLPYADNLVNLLVVQNPDNVSHDEMMRVLAPHGVAYIRNGDGWDKRVKPRPDDIDTWTHYLHDPSGNAVARDTRVGPPCRARWISEPPHTRSHEHTPSINALVTNGDRVFYLADRASIASVAQPPKWNLVARDANNGVFLWQRAFDPWFPHLHNWGGFPMAMQRRLVSVDDRVYATLGFFSPVTALDATTGEKVRVYEETKGAEEIVCHRGVLLVAARSVTEERESALKKWRTLSTKKDSPLFSRDASEPFQSQFKQARRHADRHILALDAKTGRILWRKDKKDIGWLRPTTLCGTGDRALYQNGKDVTCVDLKAGEKLWSTRSVQMGTVGSGRVICANGSHVEALSLRTGKKLWSKKTVLSQVRDTFVIDGSVWLLGFEEGTDWKGRSSPAWGPVCATERDLETGELLQHVKSEDPGHHHRCYRNKATVNYLLSGRRGVEFINTKDGDLRWNNWVRGVCRYGIMPANGLLYAPPHACACYIETKVQGFCALEGPNGSPGSAGPEEPVLERGPAYSSVNHESDGHDSGGEWPSYRHDCGRSSCTKAAVPADLKPVWEAEVGGRLSAPTVADGKVYFASVDDHTVSALDAGSGDTAWQFTAGGRVDSPPTIHAGRAIFGGRDGSVYSVRAADGALDWRLQTAGSQRLIAARGQLESSSPVHGAVLVRDGVAYLTAGRSSYLGGGIDLYRVKPETGKVLSRTNVYSPDPETGRAPEQYGPAHMPGVRWDILSSDDGHIYLRHMAFNGQGSRLEESKPHLMTLTNFLDESWAHRSYWIFGTECSISTGCSGQAKNLVYGRLLAFDDDTVYGYGRGRVHWSNQLQDGRYRLFSLDRKKNKERWTKRVPIQVRAMAVAGDVWFVAGVKDGQRHWVGSYENAAENARKDDQALLLAVSAKDGEILSKRELEATPVWDGMAAAYGRLYLCTADGKALCMAP